MNINTILVAANGVGLGSLLASFMQQKNISLLQLNEAIKNEVERLYSNPLYTADDRKVFVANWKSALGDPALSWKDFSDTVKLIGFTPGIVFDTTENVAENIKNNTSKENPAAKEPVKPGLKNVLDQKITSTGLNPRVASTLYSNKIDYIGQLTQMTKEQLLAVRGIGSKAIDQIVDILACYNVALNMGDIGWVAPSEETKANEGIDQTIYDKTLGELGLREHVVKLFTAAGYTHVGHLAQSNRKELQKNNIGNVFIDVIATHFKKHKIKFDTDLTGWKPPVVKQK